MNIDYVITLKYPHFDENEPSPTEDDIVDWIVAGMARTGFTSVDITCERQ